MTRLPAAALLCEAAIASAAAQGLPPAVEQALREAQVAPAAFSAVVEDAASGRRVLDWRSDRPLNPASVTKLVTTYAALDILGPAWTWATPVWLRGRLREGVLEGDLVIRGNGDPSLVLERAWLLLERVREAGVREIRGDIVLDDSAFAPAEAAPGDFDGDPTRPYNAQPRALMLNYGAVSYRFVPDPVEGVARVQAEPELAATPVQRRVPLGAGPCADWRGTLKASFGAEVRFAGRYPAACGEQVWPAADARPASYAGRLLQALWTQGGGRLDGRVREGAAPADAPPSFEFRSPPLAEVVRDINKYSNNLMAQQLFYTLDLARHPAQPASAAGARDLLRDWLAGKLGGLAPGTVIDNGSGLSRSTRLSADQLARLLRAAWQGPLMPELLGSLPIAGVDGTLRHAAVTPGRAHLKTGSIDGVAALAGDALGDSGRHWIVVGAVEDPRAAAARPALDALVEWALHDAAR